MDLLQLARIVARRFYVFLPVAVLAVIVAVSASGRIEPEYSVSGSAVLVGPTEVGDASSGEAVQVNPYLSFSSSLATTGQVLKLTVESPDARRQIQAEGFSRTYRVFVENRSPVITVSATSDDPEEAQQTVLRVIESMDADLASRQASANAPEKSKITMTILARPGNPAADDSGSSRVRLMIVGAGLLGAVAAAVAYDTIVNARARAGDRRHGADHDTDPTERPGSGAALDHDQDHDHDHDHDLDRALDELDGRAAEGRSRPRSPV